MSGQVPPVRPTTKTSRLAVASAVFGIFAFPLSWLVALICGDLAPLVLFLLPQIFVIASLALGIIALNQIRKSGGRIKGRALAIVGLVAGGVSLLFIGYLYLHPLSQVERPERLRARVCQQNVRLISEAIDMYAQEHAGNIPQRLEDLRVYLPNLDKLLICQSAKDQTHYSYTLTGLTNVWGVSSRIVILREIEPNHQGKRVLLFDDGHVELKADSWF